MSKQTKDILQYVGDDGEFLYPLDEYGYFTYSDTTSNFPPPVDYEVAPSYMDDAVLHADRGLAIGCFVWSMIGMYLIIMFVVLLNQG